jgi:hypothetical protein
VVSPDASDDVMLLNSVISGEEGVRKKKNIISSIYAGTVAGSLSKRGILVQFCHGNLLFDPVPPAN